MQALHFVASVLLLLMTADSSSSTSSSNRSLTTFVIVPSKDNCSWLTDAVEPCHTLAEFQMNYTNRLNSSTNTTLQFLPGVHHLHSDLVIRNTKTMVLRSNSTSDSAIISCNQSSSLVFEKVAGIRFTRMVFENCGRADNVSTCAAISLTDINLVELHQTVIVNSTSSAVAAKNTKFLVLNTAVISGSNINGYQLSHGNNPPHREERALSGSAVVIINCSMALTGENCFSNNIATSGGAILSLNSSLAMNGMTHFINNTVTGNGGAINAQDSSITITGQSEFINNCATKNGGAIFVQDCSITITGQGEFTDNCAMNNGGAIFANYTSSNTTQSHGLPKVDISGTINFTRNSVTSGKGGAVTVWFAHNVTINGNFKFANNSVSKQGYGGGALDVENCNTLEIRGAVIFQRNQGNKYGGGIEAVDVVNVSICGTLEMSDNTAELGGGFLALRVHVLTMKGNITFNRGNKGNVGGALYARDIYDNLLIHETVEFTDNTALGIGSGGALWLENITSVQVYGSAHFCNNRAYFGGAIAVVKVKTFKLSGYSWFKNNLAQPGFGGAIFSQTSTLEIVGKLTVENNSAENGGGLFLENSMCYLKPNVRVSIKRNKASKHGGGTFIDYGGYISSCSIQEQDEWIPRPPCTFQFMIDRNITIEYVNNTAELAGTAIYGGDMDECSNATVNDTGFYSNMNFSGILHIPPDDSPVANISSSPKQVCMCNGVPKCGESSIHKHVYPGETISLPIVAVGQRNGITPAVIEASFEEKFAYIDRRQHLQNTSQCTVLKYKVFSNKSNTTANLTLKARGKCEPTQKNFTVNVYFRNCPDGFTQNNKSSKCSCDEKLHNYTSTCNINNQKILRSKNAKFWVSNNNNSGLILSPYCPYDYCKSSKELHFRLDEPDEQCNHNRSGLLCGQCRSGYSLQLGSSACTENCSNWYLFLIVPFAIAGVALVAFIFVLRLTVAVGTINGLVFYANCVHAHSNLLLPLHSTPQGDPHILHVFIAWLNLDLGIATCFYENMNMYQRTWLQFVFPIYIWAICGLIIFISSRSCRLSRLLGNNPVAVLSTLLLLSYTKILKTITDAVKFTEPIGSTVVWFNDANVDIIHLTPLIVFSMLVFFILFPYSLLLLANQWLRFWSNRCAFHWMNSPRLNSFLDTYNAPFKPKFYYWNGVLLLARIILGVSRIVNISGDQAVQLLVIIVIVSLMIGWQSVFGNPYRSKTLGALETSFFLNLIFLSAATYYYSKDDSINTLIAPRISASIALATFIGIVIYHSYLQLTNLFPLLQSHDVCCSLRCCRKDLEEVQGLSADLATKTFYRESLLSELTH